MESTSATTSFEPAARPLELAFERCREEGRAALILYLTGGHPFPEEGLEVLLAVADAGADIIELGIPFSDPLADGPTIQRSSFEAIERGVSLPSILELLRRFRAQRDTPVVLFSYLNPVVRYGVDAFIRDAEAAGASGVLLTDLPVGSASEIEAPFEHSQLDLIRLIAPTSTPERVREIAQRARGFLYYVSRTGVTGASREMQAGLEAEVAAIRAAAKVPVAVGFGISTPAQAAAVSTFADGVIVGSAFVERLAREGTASAAEFVRSLRQSM